MAFTPPKPPFTDFKKDVFKKAGLVSDFIFQIGEYPELRMPSLEVTLEGIKSDAFKEKVTYLKECLLKYRELTSYGRGISAVQIGIHERFSVIYTPEKLITIINPKITRSSESLLTYPELCMSANPIIVPTVRPSFIEFEYLDESGSTQIWNTKDDTDYGKIMNRVFQHEIDHLNGIINVDIIKNPSDLILNSDPSFYTTSKFEEVTP